MVSIQEIHAIEKKRKIIKKEIYKKIYEDISRKIRSAVSIGHKQTIIRIPGYLFGYPSFDRNKACVYMKRQLDHSGFTTGVLPQGEIYVSWVKEPQTRSQRPVEEEDEEDFPTFVNLKKIANKLRKQ